MKETLVTIVIASYNNSKYINHCIETVVNQTYKNIEIIIIDDGSTDNTKRVCRNYLADTRVTFIEKQNGGLSSSRQLGLDKAKGEYISFIDADDYLEDNYVENMLNKLISEDSDICICSTRFLYEGGKETSNNNFNYQTHNTSLELTYELFCNKTLHMDVFLTLTDSWNKMYKVSFIRNTDVYFNMPKGLNGSDMLFNYCLALYEPSYSIVGDILYNHVLYENSAVHRKRKDLYSSYKYIFESMVRIAQKKGKLTVLNDKLYEMYLLYFRNAVIDLYLEGGARKLDGIKQLYIRHKDSTDIIGIYPVSLFDISTLSLRMFWCCSNSPYLLHLYAYIYTTIKKIMS